MNSRLIGINGKTHYELDSIISLTEFDNLQLDIWYGMAASKPLAMQGMSKNPIDPNDTSYASASHFISPFEAFASYQNLDSNDPLKQYGEKILNTHGKNALFSFLKYAYNVHDLLTMYFLWSDDPGWKTSPKERKLSPVCQHFLPLIKWIESLVDENVFSYIGRAYIIAHESGAISFEHRDPPSDPENPILEEFIHIRPSLNRPYYVYDPGTKTKHYSQGRVTWFNDTDVHGGDVVMEPSYAVRIDGIFTPEFRNKINNL